MKIRRSASLLLLAALAAALITSPAWAGCTNGATNWPDCNNNVPPPTSAPAGGQVQGQNQGQDQYQQQTANGGDSNSNATGGTGVGVGVGQGGAGGSSSATGGNATGGSVGDTSSSSGGNTIKGGNSDSSVGNVGSASTSRIGNVGSTSGSYSGGNKTHSSADNSGGNSAVNLDTSDHSSHSYTDNSSFTVLPPVVPPTPPAMLGVGQISTSRSSCGPQQVVVHSPYNDYYFGLFSTKTLNGGITDSLEPATLASAPNPFTIITYADGTRVWLGSQAIVSTAVLGVSGGRNLALGGGSGSGNWGQAGGGASSSMQRLVTTITVMQCVYAVGPAPTVSTPVMPQLHQRIRQ